MNWKKIRAVIRREYVEHIRKKTFWIFTILLPVLWAGFFAVSYFTQTHLQGSKRIAVVDMTGKYYDTLVADVARSKDSDKFILQKRDPGPQGLPALEADLKKEIDKKALDGYLVLDAESIEKGEIDYRAASVSDFTFQERLQNHLNRAILTARLTERGLSPDIIAQAQKHISIEGKRIDEKEGGGIATALIFFIFLYATLIQYGYINLRGVIEEKSNRIVEIIISSVRPTELMIGKIVGIGFVGLTQYAIWTILAMNLSLITGAFGVASSMLPVIPVSTLAYFVLYFILGYFLYASIYTAIGAPFNTDQEAQQLAMIPTMMIVSVWAFWGFIINSPNSPLAVVLSMIPFLTPMVMFFRVTLAPVPGWQVALSVVIMIATTFGVAWFAGKIYRVGILMYGKKPTVPEILRWVRHGDRAVRPEPVAVRPA